MTNRRMRAGQDFTSLFVVWATGHITETLPDIPYKIKVYSSNFANASKPGAEPCFPDIASFHSVRLGLHSITVSGACADVNSDRRLHQLSMSFAGTRGLAPGNWCSTGQTQLSFKNLKHYVMNPSWCGLRCSLSCNCTQAVLCR